MRGVAVGFAQSLKRCSGAADGFAGSDPAESGRADDVESLAPVDSVDRKILSIQSDDFADLRDFGGIHQGYVGKVGLLIRVFVHQFTHPPGSRKHVDEVDYAPMNEAKHGTPCTRRDKVAGLGDDRPSGQEHGVVRVEIVPRPSVISVLFAKKSDQRPGIKQLFSFSQHVPASTASIP